MTTLRKRTVRAMSWSALEMIGLTIVQFVLSTIMARLLAPEQYGLIAVLSVFINLAQTFVDSGFGSALIQKQNATQTDITTVFVFNLVTAVVCVGAVCIGAPWIARFYGQPLLAPMAAILSLGIIINALCLIQMRLMAKRLDFKTQAKIGITATVVSGTAGITMAAYGCGVWSLVFQQLSSAVIRGIMLWWMNPWRPSGRLSLTSLRELAPFGSRILGIGLMETIFKNLSRLVIAKLFSPTDLGYIERAHALSDMPVSGLTNMLNKVMFPVLSTIQDNPARLREGLRKSTIVLAWLLFPSAVGLFVVSDPLVVVLLTRKWAPCIPFLRLYCLGILVYPLYVIHMNLLKATGRSDRVMRIELVKKGLILLSILLTCRWSVIAMVSGGVIVGFISFAIGSLATSQLVHYRIRDQAMDLLPYAWGGVAMGVVAWLAGFPPYPHLWMQLVAQIAAGGTAYALFSLAFRWKATTLAVQSLSQHLGARGQAWISRWLGGIR